MSAARTSAPSAARRSAIARPLPTAAPVTTLEASGGGWLSTTRLRGATYLRAGILNTQSTADDVDGLLELLRQLAGDG